MKEHAGFCRSGAIAKQSSQPGKLPIKPVLDLNRTSDCQVNYMCINSGQFYFKGLVRKHYSLQS